MSLLLQSLQLAPGNDGTHLPGLVALSDVKGLEPVTIPEKVAQREAKSLEGRGDEKNIAIDYIYFRRFDDERSSQVAAYILDNSRETYNSQEIAELHRRVWLNGNAPLLYVEWPTRVDILKCAAEPVFWNKRTESNEYSPSDSIEVASEVSDALDQVKVQRFSAYRLSNGSFWDDPLNNDWANANKASHKALIQAVIDADRALDGGQQPLMRRMLLLTILSKYLEDRGVFPKDWFMQFEPRAISFLDVLKSENVSVVRAMLTALREKFNGDIFDLDSDIEASLDRDALRHYVILLEANTIGKQMYLWQQYSFSYIPVEVLSHLYQHFAQSGNGAVFTPPFVAELMLDHAMPFASISGDERVLDPTCGSGIFLVGAFRRLVHHWQSQNDWKRPGVPLLKLILRKSIFGVEWSEEAAHVASFNLALAMCDALQPNVIWNHLRFDKLIDRNLFVGDFFERLTDLRFGAKDGFTTILGNPPFKSKLTVAALETRPPAKRVIPIPDKQIAYRVAEESISLLEPGGSLCMIEPHGFLYNTKARAFLADFFTTCTVESVLDFVSIRNLFEGADPKTVAIVARAELPEANHQIVHQTFRRTKSVHDRIGFELDHYDRHVVAQEMALKEPWIWKANLLGGGRLQALGLKVALYPTLKQHVESQGWTHGVGFIVGRNVKRQNPDDWLPKKPFLPVYALTNKGINKEKLSLVVGTDFEAPRKPARFTPPMFLISKNENLPSAFWNSDILTFQDRIVSINASPDEAEKLANFANAFERNKKRLSIFCLLKSTQALVGKSTALLKRDIDELPWPKNGDFDLAWWEDVLLDDVATYLSQLIRVGQNSRALTESVTSAVFDVYAKIFVRLLGSIYTNLRIGKFGYLKGVAYQGFYFGEETQLDWPENWSEKLERVIFKNDCPAMRTSRVLRFYETNTLIIVKPDRLRHWIGSTAIRDADETLVDLQKQGF